MLRLVVATLLLADGGSVTTPFTGALEPGATYVLEGEHAPAKGLSVFAALRPPRLRLPMHHAGRVEWVDGEPSLPEGHVRVTFVVEKHEVVRVSERRWNSTWRCRLLSATTGKH